MHEHRLTAIMFTDIMGYTAIMQDDEQNALQIIDENDNLHELSINTMVSW